MVCSRRMKTATLRVRRRKRVVGSELPMENCSDVLQVENCCAVGTENGSGTLLTKKMSC